MDPALNIAIKSIFLNFRSDANDSLNRLVRAWKCKNGGALIRFGEFLLLLCSIGSTIEKDVD